MREKYRAWDKYKEIMYVVEGIDFIEQAISVRDEDIPKYFKKLYLDSSVVLMQSTGLKDINGVEVYEGDYLSLIHFDENVEFKGEVVYSEGSFCMTVRLKGRQYKVPLHDVANSDSVIKVIGNIYENPELLEVE